MKIVILFVLPFLLGLTLCRVAMALNIVDAPDGKRKLQDAPVPSTGGLGVVAAVVLSLTVFVAALGFSAGEFWDVLVQNCLAGPAVYVLGLAAIGFADDALTLAAGPKFAMIAALSLIGAGFGPWPQDVWVPFAGETALASWFAIGGAALWLFVVANAVNFMDGANGLAMGSSAIMLGAIAVLLSPFAAVSWSAPYVAGMFAASVIALVAICGFLVWNVRGRVYAGDMGALFVGGLLGVFGLLVGQFYSIWLAPLLVLPFIGDVLLTMASRARHGENLLTPHREHAYQLLIRAGWPHVKVAALWWALAALCGGAAILAVKGVLLAGRLDMLRAVSLATFLLLLAIGVGVWCAQRRWWDRVNRRG